MTLDFTDEWLDIARRFTPFSEYVECARLRGLFRYLPVMHEYTLCPWPFAPPSMPEGLDAMLVEPLGVEVVPKAHRYERHFALRLRWKPKGLYEGRARDAAELNATILAAAERIVARHPGAKEWPGATVNPVSYLADRVHERLGPHDPPLELRRKGRYRLALTRGARRVLARAERLTVVDARFDDTTPGRETCDYEEFGEYDAFVAAARAWLAGAARHPKRWPRPRCH